VPRHKVNYNTEPSADFGSSGEGITDGRIGGCEPVFNPKWDREHNFTTRVDTKGSSARIR